MVRNEISKNISIHFDNIFRYIIYLTCFGERTERTESESISYRKHWYFLGRLSSEMLEKKPFKILHNLVYFLPFSIRLFFFTFQRPLYRGIIVFQVLSISFVIWKYHHVCGLALIDRLLGVLQIIIVKINGLTEWFKLPGSGFFALPSWIDKIRTASAFLNCLTLARYGQKEMATLPGQANLLHVNSW